MAKSKPNLVFFFNDQHRYDALGCNGAEIVQTPAIDSIAAQGMRFTNAFTPVALCTPARSSLISGQYPHNHGQLANMADFNGVFDRNILNQPNFMSHLRQAGYQIGWYGKWHMPEEGNRDVWAIDRYGGSREWHQHLNMPDYNFARDELQRLEWGREAPFQGRSTLPAEKMQEAWTADRAIESIHEFADNEQPFALMLCFFGPHFPYSVPAPYDTMYCPDEVKRPTNFDERFIEKPPLQQKEMLRWNTGHLTWKDWQKVIATYWGYCTYIDDQIKRVMDALVEAGVDDDTVLIFSADHGDMLGNHRLFNKGFNMYDEIHHIPLLVRAPGLAEPGGVSDAFVNLVDLAPTLLDLAAAEPLPNADGRSIVPLLEGETPEDWWDDVLCEFHGYESTLVSCRMVRTHKWKYVYNPTSIDELYDLESDPGEMHNLVNYIGFKHILRDMKARLVARLQASGDTIAGDDSWKGSSYDLYLARREQ